MDALSTPVPCIIVAVSMITKSINGLSGGNTELHGQEYRHLQFNSEIKYWVVFCCFSVSLKLNRITFTAIYETHLYLSEKCCYSFVKNSNAVFDCLVTDIEAELLITTCTLNMAYRL